MEQPGSLMRATLRLLDETDKSLPDIANAVGVSFYWLRKFKSGEISNPSVNRVERLYNYLSGKHFDVP